jgi:predicted house-cleaning noncanonical NTP pyrophosphatase (MazG superfamily)
VPVCTGPSRQNVTTSAPLALKALSIGTTCIFLLLFKVTHHISVLFLTSQEMKVCNTVTFFLIIHLHRVAGFTILTTRCITTGRKVSSFGGYCRTTTLNIPRFFGVLDDFINVSCSSSSLPPTEEEEKYESLFHHLVFSTSSNTRRDVQDRLEECSDPGFLQWLEWNMEESEDDEERQALHDLLEMIDQIATDEAESQQQQQQLSSNSENQQESIQGKNEELGMTGTTTATATTIIMSASDILKKASAIDRAVMVAEEASEEEKPLDFIRDAKAERGLGGFNNRGQMRVGGG